MDVFMTSNLCSRHQSEEARERWNVRERSLTRHKIADFAFRLVRSVTLDVHIPHLGFIELSSTAEWSVARTGSVLSSIPHSIQKGVKISVHILCDIAFPLAVHKDQSSELVSV